MILFTLIKRNIFSKWFALKDECFFNFVVKIISIFVFLFPFLAIRSYELQVILKMVRLKLRSLKGGIKQIKKDLVMLSKF